MAMMVLTIISKCLGFVRELVIARYFGTSYIVDATVMAIGIPTIIFGAVFTSINTSFMPNFSEVREKLGLDESNKFLNSVITLELLIGLITIAFSAFFPRQIVHLFAKNFTADTASLTVKILPFAFASLLICGLVTILGAYLQYNGKMLIGIIAGYFFDIGMISGAVYFANHNREIYVFSYVFGYFLQFFIIFVAALIVGMKIRISLKITEQVKKMFSMALPVYIGSQLSSINMFVDRSMASGLSEGSIASLNYANILNGVTTTLTIGILSTIIYPQINRAVNTGDSSTFEFLKGKIQNIVLLICIPLTLGTIVFAEPVTQVVYERGAFDTNSTLMTAECLRFYAIGITFTSLVNILVNFSYSLKDSKTPILYSPITILINIILNIILVKSMEYKGLALATSISAIVNFLLAIYFLPKKHKELKINPDFTYIFKILFSSVVSVTMAMITYKYISMVCVVRTINLIASVIIAIICYSLFMLVFKIKEFMILLNMFKPR